MSTYWLIGGLLVLGMLMGCQAQSSSREPASNKPPEKKPEAEKKSETEKPAAAEVKTPPAEYKVKFTTSKGEFVVEVKRDWSPRGADRFYELVQAKFYDDCRFFRVLSGFMAQFGINGDPKTMTRWSEANIADDPVTQSNTRGMITYAMAGPNTRTTQLFINFGNNARLDGMGFSPFGKVVEGMDVVDALYSGYGEGAPSGRGPQQGRIQAEGNDYLNKDFPKLDYIKTVRIVE